MSEHTIIVDVETKNGRITVEHVIATTLDKHKIMQVVSHYEVLVNDVVKHESNDPEDIMRALGHYIAGLS